MQKLQFHDQLWALRLMPKALTDLLGNFPNKIFVAGGFIRSAISQEKINDIDLFTASKDDAWAYALILAKGDKEKIYETDNALTVKGLRIPIQFIHRWTFDKPEDCIQSFDFTIACAAIWWDGSAWASLCDESFYPDLAAKRLIYRSPKRDEEPGGSMLRVLKYYQKGYRIPLDSLGAVIARLVRDLDLSRMRISEEHHVARILTGLLHEVDPNIDPDHLAHLPAMPESEKQIV